MRPPIFLMTSLCLALLGTAHAANINANPVSEKSVIKTKLKNLTVNQRDQMIARAKVFNTFDAAAEVGSTEPSTVNVIEDLQKRCGSLFEYKKSTSNDVYEWPVVECRYRQDDLTLGGGTSKFYCDIKDESDKDGVKKRKVKYAPYGAAANSELFQTILGVNTAHLLGFFTELYCPARIVCIDCPSEDPWKKNRRSSGSPRAGSKSFEWAMVELPLPYPQITNPPSEPNPRKSQGLKWEELFIVAADTPEERRQMRIEREAWILWINLIQEIDAYAFNQRLSCADPKLIDDKVQCTTPVVYTHDYGHAFYGRFRFALWEQTYPLKAGADGSCIGTLSNETYIRERKVDFRSILLEPKISEEARNLLVQRLTRISDKQWSDIYQLSRAELGTQVTTAAWLQAIHKKIDQLKSVPCQPFASGNSVLAL